MATQEPTRLTYSDLLAFPEDNFRRELIDGELIVTPSPATRHQQVVKRFIHAFATYEEAHGGEVLPAPFDVYFSDINVVEPDVLFIRADNLNRLEKRFIRGAPDIVIEVSSPSTRKLELQRKLQLYERFGVPEYWYIDLDADRVEVYRLIDDAYPHPGIFGHGDALTSQQVPGFSVEIDYILGPA